MPSNKVHCALDRLFFGREFPDVHRKIDSAAARFGVFHRLVNHAPWDVLKFRPEERPVVVLHHVADFVLTPLSPIFEPGLTIDIVRSVYGADIV